MTLKDIKKKLTDEQIISFIKHLGGSHKINNNNPNEIIFQTVCHESKDGNRKHKLYYYKSSQSFYCYSRCSAIGDIYKLTGHVLGLDPSESVKYVLKFFNITGTVAPIEEEDFGFDDEDEDEDIVLQSIKLEDIEVEYLPPIKKQKIMRTFIKYYCKDWLNDGISKETMDKYDIKFSCEKMGVIIPHHNIYGEVVGIRVRNLEGYAIENFGKYTPLYLNGKMYNHQLGRNIYGLDKNKEAIKKYKKVVVFEGEKSVLQMDTAYGENSIAVAICGSNMNRVQMKMLLDLGVEEVIFALDKQYDDKSSESLWRKKVERLAKPMIEYGIECSRIWDSLENGLLEYKESPIDKTKEVYSTLVKNRIKITIKEENKEDDKV